MKKILFSALTFLAFGATAQKYISLQILKEVQQVGQSLTKMVTVANGSMQTHQVSLQESVQLQQVLSQLTTMVQL